MDPGGFAIAILPVVLSPGASFTLAMNSALTSGTRGVLTIMAGTALGIFTHALLVGLGITAALTAFPSLFGALKIAGTIYLLWLGCRLIRGGLTAQPLRLTAQTQPITLTQAWLANVINPKALLLYLTVVSRFAGNTAGPGAYLLLASMHIAIMVAWLTIASQLLLRSVERYPIDRLRKWVDIGGGLLLILFALSALT